MTESRRPRLPGGPARVGGLAAPGAGAAGGPPTDCGHRRAGPGPRAGAGADGGPRAGRPRWAGDGAAPPGRGPRPRRAGGRTGAGTLAGRGLCAGTRTSATRTTGGTVVGATGHGLPQLAHNGGLDGGGGGLHVLPEILQFAEDLLATDAELFGELMHAGLACHCTPCYSEAGGWFPLDLEPSVEARSWCDLHDWLMTGRPCSLLRRARALPGPRLRRSDAAVPDRCPADPGRAAPAGTPSVARHGGDIPGRDATTHRVREAAAADPGPRAPSTATTRNRPSADHRVRHPTQVRIGAVERPRPIVEAGLPCGIAARA